MGYRTHSRPSGPVAIGNANVFREHATVHAPEGHAPWIVTLFISDAEVDFATRDAALQDLSAAVVAVIKG